MKNKILLTLFVINTLLLIAYLFPVLRMLIPSFFNSEAAAIGVVGGVDGPTAVFVSTNINWFLVIVVALELIIGAWLLVVLFKKILASS